MIFPARLILAGSLLLSLTVSEPAVAGPLRDRLKERIVTKLENAPAPSATAAVTDKITAPGDYTFSLPQQGLNRFYMVHVPASLNAARPAAVLFAFHGGGGDMTYMANDEYYGLIGKSDKEGFVVVFPNGYSKFQSGKLAAWNAGNCCGDARDKKIDDVGFVRGMVAAISGQMNIDRSRIFAAGMSNGGMMVERLACEMADTFKAVASVAGSDNTTQCQPSRPISVLNIHARNDDHVLFNGGAGEGSFKDPSKVTDFTAIPETVSRWVSRNRCSPTPSRVVSVPGAYCDRYSGCANGVAVQLCVTESGGHSWPGGYKPRGDEPASKAISANDEIWKFFNSLP